MYSTTCGLYIVDTSNSQFTLVSAGMDPALQGNVGLANEEKRRYVHCFCKATV